MVVRRETLFSTGDDAMRLLYCSPRDDDQDEQEERCTTRPSGYSTIDVSHEQPGRLALDSS